MRYSTLYYSLFVALFICLGSGCEPEEPLGEPMGTECVGHCLGPSTICINGTCGCEDPALEIAPGFCVQRAGGYNYAFVSYDQHPNIIDTMILGFQEDPYLETWQTGDSRLRVLGAWAYGREPSSIPSSNVFAAMLYSGDFNQHVDTIKVTSLLNENNRNFYRVGEWVVKTDFAARFVDANTIVGDARIYSVKNRNNPDAPRPENLPEVGERFPVTFRRVIF